MEISNNLCPAFVNGDTAGGRMAAARLCSIQIVKYNGNGNPEAINKRGVGVRQRLVSDKMRAGAGAQRGTRGICCFE